MRIWEITLASFDREALAPQEAQVRACVRALVRSFAPEKVDLIGFCLRGDRLRLLVAGQRGPVGHRCAGLRRALASRTAVPIASVAVRELHHRAHLLSILRHYVAPVDGDGFGQPAPLASGSCWADLVGARCVTGLRLVTHGVLPRLGARGPYDMLGLRPVEPASDELVRMLGPSRIASAASFVVCADPALRGEERHVVSARRATAQLATAVGIPVSEIAWALRITARGARRLGSEAIDEQVLRAVRLRLAIQIAVHRAVTAGACAG